MIDKIADNIKSAIKNPAEAIFRADEAAQSLPNARCKARQGEARL